MDRSNAHKAQCIVSPMSTAGGIVGCSAVRVLSTGERVCATGCRVPSVG